MDGGLTAFGRAQAIIVCNSALNSLPPATRQEIIEGRADFLLTQDGSWRGRFDRTTRQFRIVHEPGALPVGCYIKLDPPTYR